jgi:hypothetical protein
MAPLHSKQDLAADNRPKYSDGCMNESPSNVEPREEWVVNECVEKLSNGPMRKISKEEKIKNDYLAANDAYDDEIARASSANTIPFLQTYSRFAYTVLFNLEQVLQ